MPVIETRVAGTLDHRDGRRLPAAPRAAWGVVGGVGGCRVTQEFLRDDNQTDVMLPCEY
jgi:hypothetical protein